MRELLMGDEAVALAALDAGIRGAFSYPGTPATEILECIQRRVGDNGEVAARWSANEKVAYEEGLGASFAGKRALVSMKHVGLNVAADPFMSSALTGAQAGLVVAVADDPGMHSSQNEQDTRYYAQFGQVPLFEPANQQEAYDMTREAFVLSERFHIPVLVRLVTRLAHSRADVERRAADKLTRTDRARNWRDWTLLPVNARKRFRRLLDLQEEFLQYTQRSPFNGLALKGPKGIIAAGLAYNYLREATRAESAHSILKIGVYPVPSLLVRDLVAHCDEILVVEEGYPFIESQLRGLLGVPGKVIRGKFDGALPVQGELTTDIVRAALGMASAMENAPVDDLPQRPPQLCSGCPHCDSFRAVLDAVGEGQDPYYFSDIGCYALAALPPYNAIDTCVEMGASIGMAIGAAKTGAHPVVATIGDSTFIHSGLSSLVGAAHEDVNMTVVILDNATVGMTGGQDVFASGDDLIRVIKGLGVAEEHIVRLEPLPKHHEENVRRMRREIDHRGLSVVVACRPCIHVKGKGRRNEGTKGRRPVEVTA